MPYRDQHPSEGAATDLAQLDQKIAEAARQYGGLSENEYPTNVAVVMTTMGWDAAGREYSDLHVLAPGISRKPDVANLLREGLNHVQAEHRT